MSIGRTPVTVYDHVKSFGLMFMIPSSFTEKNILRHIHVYDLLFKRQWSIYEANPYWGRNVTMLNPKNLWNKYTTTIVITNGTNSQASRKYIASKVSDLLTGPSNCHILIVTCCCRTSYPPIFFVISFVTIRLELQHTLRDCRLLSWIRVDIAGSSMNSLHPHLTSIDWWLHYFTYKTQFQVMDKSTVILVSHAISSKVFRLNPVGSDYKKSNSTLKNEMHNL